MRHERETGQQDYTEAYVCEYKEGGLKRKWRNPGWMGVVSSIVIGGGESPLHGEGLDGST